MSIFKHNIDALHTRHPQLARILSTTAPSSRIKIFPSKRGDPTLKDMETGKLLHSAYDPVKEGLRFFSLHGTASYLCILGMGCAYHIRPYLLSTETTRIVVLEEDMAQFRLLIEHVDMCRIFLSEKCALLINTSVDDLYAFILHDYLPLLYPSVLILTLPAGQAMQPDFFRSRKLTIQGALQRQQEDEIVMQRFGKRWVYNIVKNLLRIPSKKIEAPIRKKALLVAAGPSVETKIEYIRRWKHALIAVDSVLPLLLHARVHPNMVVSIDCQIYGYLHFLNPRSHFSPIFSQLSAYCPPFLRHPQFFLGNHPLEQWLCTHGLSLPSISKTGGNVSSAAMLLLRRLGYTSIETIGNDFSYPQAKCYARGTYFYRVHSLHSHQLRSLYTRNTLYALSGTREESDAQGVSSYVSSPMQQYKKSFENAVHSNEVMNSAPQKDQHFDARKCLHTYVEDLRSQLDTSSQNNNTTLMTVFPLASWIAKQHHITEPKEKIHEAVLYTIRFISSFLDR